MTKQRSSWSRLLILFCVALWSSHFTQLADSLPVITSIVVTSGGSCMLTDGTSTLALTGTGFGTPGTAGTLTWSSYSSTCNIVSAVSATCTTVSGVGTGYLFRLLSDGGQGTVGVVTGYCAPTVTGVTGPATLSTSGSDTVVISGTNFGTATPTSVQWRPTAITASGALVTFASCSVTTAHTQITCTTPAWVGQLLIMTLTISTQAVTYTTSLSYAIPVITSAQGNTGLNPGTSGAIITFSGSSFGPVTFPAAYIGVTFGPNGAPKALTGCSIALADARITCVSVACVGSALPVIMTIGGTNATQSTAITISYAGPTITSISNSPLTSGGLLSLVGTNFGPSVASQIPWSTIVTASMGLTSPYNSVALTACSVVTVNTLIVCTVPAGVGGTWTLITTVGAQTSPGSTTGFSYQLPTISFFSLTVIPTDAATTATLMTLTGTNFGPAGTTATITFGATTPYTQFACGSAVVPASVPHTTITCAIPAGYGGSTGHKWAISIAGSTPQVSTATTRYATPTVSGVTGAGLNPTDTLGTQTVVIQGLNYGIVGSGAAISAIYRNSLGMQFTASGCSVTTSHYGITCAIVAGAGLNYVFYVTVEAQTSTSVTACPANCVTYPLPVVQSVTFAPGTMSTSGGQTGVSITGYNFGPSTIGSTITARIGVSFALISCTFVASQTTVTCTTPSGAGKDLPVFVTINTQESVLASGVVLSYTPPVITGITPRIGRLAGNTLITITGTNFHSLAQYDNSSSCVSVVGTPTTTQMICRTRATTTSVLTVNMIVSIGNQISVGYPFYYYWLTPTFTPTFGHYTLDNTVTVTGDGFSQYMVGSSIATMFQSSITRTGAVTVSSATSLSYTFPGSQWNPGVGTAMLAVSSSFTLNGGADSEALSSSFSEYRTDVSAINIHSGPTTGGTIMTVAGMFFTTGTALAQFGSGNLASNVVFVNTGQITLVAPAATATGLLYPQVSTEADPTSKYWASGTSAGAVAQFMYYDPPTVTTLSPPLGPLGGATSVTITGTNIVTTPLDEAKCRFGTIVITATFVSVTGGSTAVVCQTPSVAFDQTVSVEIALNGQQYTTNGVQFRYYVHPTLSFVRPLYGPMRGATQLTLKGDLFYANSATLVRFTNGTATFDQTATVTDSTTITVSTPAVFSSWYSDRTSPDVSCYLLVSLNGQQWNTINTVRNFTYYVPAWVQTVSPALGIVSGGTNVTITARAYPTGYFAAQFIDSTGIPATVTCVTSITSATAYNAVTTAVCTSPPRLQGTAAVAITVDTSDQSVVFSTGGDRGAFVYHGLTLPTYVLSPGHNLFATPSSAVLLVDASVFVNLPVSALSPAVRYQQIITQGATTIVYASFLEIAARDNCEPFAYTNPSATATAPSYQRLIVINTVNAIATGIMSASCNSIHFGVASNSGRTWTELPFYLESYTCNSAATRFWVRIPAVAASTTLSMYACFRYVPSGTAGVGLTYGSNAATTFAFNDQFDVLPQPTDTWIQPSYVSVSYGQLVRQPPSRQFRGLANMATSPRAPVTVTVGYINDIATGFMLQGRWIFNASTSGECISHHIYWSTSPVAWLVDGTYDTTPGIESLQWDCNGNVIFWNGAQRVAQSNVFTPVTSGSSVLGVRLLIRVVAGVLRVQQMDAPVTTVATYSSHAIGTLYVFAGAQSTIPTNIATELSSFWIGTAITDSAIPTTGISLAAVAKLWAFVLNIPVQNTSFPVDVTTSTSVALNFNGQLRDNQFTNSMGVQYNYQPPTIDSITPAMVPYSVLSTVVTITGTGFPDSGLVLARFQSDISAAIITTCSYVSSTSITCIPPVIDSGIMLLYAPSLIQLSFDNGADWIISNATSLAYYATSLATSSAAAGVLTGGQSFELDIDVAVSQGFVWAGEFQSSDVGVTFAGVAVTVTSAAIDVLSGYIHITVTVPPASVGGYVAVSISVYRNQALRVAAGYLYINTDLLVMSPHGSLATRQTIRDITRTTVRFTTTTPSLLPVAAAAIGALPTIQQYLLVAPNNTQVTTACSDSYTLGASSIRTATLTQRTELLTPAVLSDSAHLPFPFFNSSSISLVTQSLYTANDISAIGIKVGDTITELQLYVTVPSNVHMHNLVIKYAFVDSTLSQLYAALDSSITMTTIYTNTFLPMSMLRECIDLSTGAQCWIRFVLATPISYTAASGIVLQLSRTGIAATEVFGPAFVVTGTLAMRSTLLYRTYWSDERFNMAVYGVPALKLITTRLELSIAAPETTITTPFLLVPSLSGIYNVPDNTSALWTQRRLCSYTDGTILTQFVPGSVDRSQSTKIQLFGAYLDVGTPIDSSLWTARFVITSRATRFYVEVPATLVKTATQTYISVATPSEEAFGGQTKTVSMLIDLSLNGQVYTEPFHPLSIQFLAYDSPKIVSFTPLSTPQIGGGYVTVTGQNILYRYQGVTCNFANPLRNFSTNIIAIPVNSTSGYCTTNCYFKCEIPGIPYGNVTLSVSLNTIQFSPAALQMTYLPCASGTTAGSYTSPCKVCAAGLYANDDQSQCLLCGLDTYSPVAYSQGSCLKCPLYAKTLSEGSVQIRDCLCPAPAGSAQGYFKPNDRDATPCRPCPSHATCAGGWELPVPLSGFNLDHNNNASVFPCDPPEGCLTTSATSCGEGYDPDFGCLSCESGYYRKVGRCWSCESHRGKLDPWYAVSLSFHLVILLFIWYFIDIVVELGSLTALASLLNAIIVLSFMRVLWPSSFIGALPGMYWLATVFFWPDFISLAAWECRDGPLEQFSAPTTFSKHVYIWPLLMPLVQMAVFFTFSLLQGAARKYCSGRVKQIDNHNWSPTDRFFNSVNIVLVMESPYIWHHILARFSEVPRDDVTNRQWLRPALTYTPGDGVDAVFVILALFCLIPSFLALWPTIDVSVNTGSRWLLAIFKQYQQSYAYTKRWSMALTAFSCVVAFSTSNIAVQESQFQAFLCLVFLVALGVCYLMLWPFVNRDANKVGGLSSFALSLLVFVGLAYSRMPYWMVTLTEWIVAIFVIYTLIYAFITPILEFLRHRRLKKSQLSLTAGVESDLAHVQLLLSFLEQLRATLHRGQHQVTSTELRKKLEQDAAFREDAEVALRSLFRHYLFEHQYNYTQLLNDAVSGAPCSLSTCRHDCFRHHQESRLILRSLLEPNVASRCCRDAREWLRPTSEATVSPNRVAVQVVALMQIGLRATHCKQARARQGAYIASHVEAELAPLADPVLTLCTPYVVLGWKDAHKTAAHLWRHFRTATQAILAPEEPKIRPIVNNIRISSRLGRARHWQRFEQGGAEGLGLQAGDILDVDIGLVDDQDRPLRRLPPNASVVGSLVWAADRFKVPKLARSKSLLAKKVRRCACCCEDRFARRCEDASAACCGGFPALLRKWFSRCCKCCGRPKRVDGSTVRYYPSLLRFQVSAQLEPGRYVLNLAVNGEPCRVTSSATNPARISAALRTELLKLYPQQSAHWPSLGRIMIQAPLEANTSFAELYSGGNISGIIADEADEPSDMKLVATIASPTGALDLALRDVRTDAPCLVIRSRRQFHFTMQLIRLDDPAQVDHLTVGTSGKSSLGRMRCEPLREDTDHKVLEKYQYRVRLEPSAGRWKLKVDLPGAPKEFDVTVTPQPPVWESSRFCSVPQALVSDGILRVGFACEGLGGTGLVDSSYLYASCQRLNAEGLPLPVDNCPAKLIARRSPADRQGAARYKNLNEKDVYEVQFQPAEDGDYVVRMAVFGSGDVPHNVGFQPLQTETKRARADDAKTLADQHAVFESKREHKGAIASASSQPKLDLFVGTQQFIALQPAGSDKPTGLTRAEELEWSRRTSHPRPTAPWPIVAVVSTVVHLKGAKRPPPSKWASFWSAGHVTPVHSIIAMKHVDRVITSSSDQTRVWEMSSGRTVAHPLPMSNRLLELKMRAPLDKDGLGVHIDVKDSQHVKPMNVCVLGAARMSQMTMWAPSMDKDGVIDLSSVLITADGKLDSPAGDLCAGMVDLDCGKPDSLQSRVLTWAVHPQTNNDLPIIRCWRVISSKPPRQADGNYESYHMLVHINHVPVTTRLPAIPRLDQKIAESILGANGSRVLHTFTLPAEFNTIGFRVRAMTVVRDCLFVAYTSIAIPSGIAVCAIGEHGLTLLHQHRLPPHADYHVRYMTALTPLSDEQFRNETKDGRSGGRAGGAAAAPIGPSDIDLKTAQEPVVLALFGRHILRVTDRTATWLAIGDMDQVQSVGICGRRFVIVAQRPRTSDNRDSHGMADPTSSVLSGRYGADGDMVGARELKFNQMLSSALNPQVPEEASSRGSPLLQASRITAGHVTYTDIRDAVTGGAHDAWSSVAGQPLLVKYVGDADSNIIEVAPLDSTTADARPRVKPLWPMHSGTHPVSMLVAADPVRIPDLGQPAPPLTITDVGSGLTRAHQAKEVFSAAGPDVYLWHHLDDSFTAELQLVRKFNAHHRCARFGAWITFFLTTMQWVSFPFATIFGWPGADVGLLSFILFRFDLSHFWPAVLLTILCYICLVAFFVSWCRFRTNPTSLAHLRHNQVPRRILHALSGALLIPVIRSGIYWIRCYGGHFNQTCDEIQGWQWVILFPLVILLPIYAWLSIRLRMVDCDVNCIRVDAPNDVGRAGVVKQKFMAEDDKRIWWGRWNPFLFASFTRQLDVRVPDSYFALKPRVPPPAANGTPGVPSRRFHAYMAIASVVICFMTATAEKGTDDEQAQAGIIFFVSLPLLLLALFDRPYESDMASGLNLAMVWMASLGALFTWIMTAAKTQAGKDRAMLGFNILALPTFIVIWSCASYILWVKREDSKLGKLWDALQGLGARRDDPATPRRPWRDIVYTCWTGRRDRPKAAGEADEDEHHVIDESMKNVDHLPVAAAAAMMNANATAAARPPVPARVSVADRGIKMDLTPAMAAAGVGAADLLSPASRAEANVPVTPTAATPHGGHHRDPSASPLIGGGDSSSSSSSTPSRDRAPSSSRDVRSTDYGGIPYGAVAAASPSSSAASAPPDDDSLMSPVAHVPMPWTCPACYQTNQPGIAVCATCQSPQPVIGAVPETPVAAPAAFDEFGNPIDAAAASSGYGYAAAPSAGAAAFDEFGNPIASGLAATSMPMVGGASGYEFGNPLSTDASLTSATGYVPPPISRPSAPPPVAASPYAHLTTSNLARSEEALLKQIADAEAAQAAERQAKEEAELHAQIAALKAQEEEDALLAQLAALQAEARASTSQ